MVLSVFSENNRVVASIPFYAHYLFYLWPTLLLATGIFLFRLTKIAIPLSLANLLVLMAQPFLLAHVFSPGQVRCDPTAP